VQCPSRSASPANCTTTAVNGVQTAAQSYNAANQVVGWSYDAAGNLLGYGAGDVYAYDGLGRMTSQDGTLM
jgi:YD repeat-containing protein